MDQQARFNFYKDLYFFELQRRDAINASVSLPVGVASKTFTRLPQVHRHRHLVRPRDIGTCRSTLNCPYWRPTISPTLPIGPFQVLFEPNRRKISAKISESGIKKPHGGVFSSADVAKSPRVSAEPVLTGVAGTMVRWGVMVGG